MIEVVRSKKGIIISQWKYTINLFDEIGKLGAKLVDTGKLGENLVEIHIG